MTITLADPATTVRLSGNCYDPRGKPMPKWIAFHTSEGRNTADGLAGYCERAGVSYNRIVSDRAIITTVRDTAAPWAAMNANQFALHLCFSNSFAAWSRGQWLDPNPTDGYNENDALTNGAKVLAFWHQQHGIPMEWIGGHGVPWGRDGLLGHVDFGQWGGGHHDPDDNTGNFPRDEIVRRAYVLIGGDTPGPAAPLPPVVVPGTNPDKYAHYLLYQGNPNNDRDQVMAVQAAMNRPPTPFGLVVDGDYGPLTAEAIRGYQAHVGLVADGIVGPMTAAALRP